MLLTLLYHKIGDGKYANRKKIMQEHLLYIANNYQSYFPGQKLPFRKTGLCLTFDDGYFDFYHIIFPLLKSLNIKAVLAISPAFIQKTTNLDPSYRLSSKNPYLEAKEKVPFCTWEELKIMSSSPFVKIASHSYSHANLTRIDCDLEKEIIDSKNIIEENLNTSIDTFVYPYGKFNKSVHKLVKNHYPYIMRIGSAINYSWHNTNQLIYRIPCDQLPSIYKPFKGYPKYYLRLLLNTLRKK